MMIVARAHDRLSEILCERPRLLKRFAGRHCAVRKCLLEAVVQVVVDHLSLCICECVLDGMQLLRDIDALAASFDHADEGAQMPFRALQAFDD
jgi:hypothetical protein